MENSFKLEVLRTNKILKTNEQSNFRLKFKPFLNIEGVISLCLAEEHLYIEYDPMFFNLESFKESIITVGFPLQQEDSLNLVN